MPLDSDNNCTHIHVRKSSFKLTGGEIVHVWTCMDCPQQFEPCHVAVEKEKRDGATQEPEEAAPQAALGSP